MSEMKCTSPEFPHMEVFKRILGVIQFFTNDPRDVAAICTTLACYALRWSQNKQGKSLDQIEWQKWCLNAYARSDDAKANIVMTQTS